MRGFSYTPICVCEREREREREREITRKDPNNETTNVLSTACGPSNRNSILPRYYPEQQGASYNIEFLN